METLKNILKGQSYRKIFIRCSLFSQMIREKNFNKQTQSENIVGTIQYSKHDKKVYKFIMEEISVRCKIYTQIMMVLMRNKLRVRSWNDFL